MMNFRRVRTTPEGIVGKVETEKWKSKVRFLMFCGSADKHFRWKNYLLRL